MMDTGPEVKMRVRSEERRKKKKNQEASGLLSPHPGPHTHTNTHTYHPPVSCCVLQNFAIHSDTVMYRCLNVLLHDTLVS